MCGCVRIVRLAHLIHDEWNSNVLCFSKKSEVLYCLLCVDLCWYSRIMEVLLSLAGNLTVAPTIWVDLNVFLSYFKQWPSDLPMESYIFLLSIFTYEKNVFFSRISAYLNYFKLIYCSIFFKYVLIFQRNSMCFFSFLNIRKNVFLENYKTVATLSLLSHYVFLVVLFSVRATSDSLSLNLN